MPRTPLTLRLPFWLVDHGFRLDRAVAQDPRWCVRPAHAVPRLRLSGPEQRFAKAMLRDRRSWWLFRCDQAAGCGDFVLLPMSSPDPALRMPVVLELKGRSPVKAGRGLQLRNAGAAVAELAAVGLATGPDHRRMEGSTSAVLQRLGVSA